MNKMCCSTLRKVEERKVKGKNEVLTLLTLAHTGTFFYRTGLSTCIGTENIEFFN